MRRKHLISRFFPHRWGYWLLLLLCAVFVQTGYAAHTIALQYDAREVAETRVADSLNKIGYTRADSSLVPHVFYRLSPLRAAGRDAGYDLLDSITPWMYALRQRNKLIRSILDASKSTKPSTLGRAMSISSSILFGHNFFLPHGWLFGVDGLVFAFPEKNDVDGLWCGYELYAAHRLNERTQLSARANAYYTTKRKRWVAHSFLALHYSPERDGFMLLGAGFSTGNVNLLNGHQIFLQRYPSGALGNGPTRAYERRWALIRNEVGLFPWLGLDATALYEHRFPIRPWALFGEHKAFTVEGRLRLHLASPAQVSSFGRAMYALPTGLGVPELLLSYRQAIPGGGGRSSEPPYSDYARAEVGIKGYLFTDQYAHFQYYISGGGYLWRKYSTDWDGKTFPSAQAISFDHSFYTYQALRPAYDAGNRWTEIQATYLSRRLLISHLTHHSPAPFDEALHLRTIIPLQRQHHAYTEVGYSIGLSYLARLGFYYGFEYGGEDRGFFVRLSLPILQLTRLWGERSVIP